MAAQNNITMQHESTLVEFARQIGFKDVESVLYFFEKPHKWQTEFDKWNELDQPTSEADANWEAWQTFVVNRDTSSE